MGAELAMEVVVDITGFRVTIAGVGVAETLIPVTVGVLVMAGDDVIVKVV